MIYRTLDYQSFKEEFEKYDRGNQFPNTLGTLFDYIEESGDDYELDVIGLCCEFVEMTEKEIKEECRVEDLDELDRICIEGNPGYYLVGE